MYVPIRRLALSRGGLGVRRLATHDVSSYFERRAKRFDQLYTAEELSGLGSRRAVPVSHADARSGRDEADRPSLAGEQSQSEMSFRERLRRARDVSRSTVSAAAAQPRAATAAPSPPSATKESEDARIAPASAQGGPAQQADKPKPPPPPPPPQHTNDDSTGASAASSDASSSESGSPPPRVGHPEEKEEGERLLVRAPEPVIHRLSAIVGSIPGIFSSLSLAMDSMGFGLQMPLWAVGIGFASSGAAVALSVFLSTRNVQSIVALPDGCHVRVSTVSGLGLLPGSQATVPVPFFKHRHGKSGDTIVLAIAPPGGKPAFGQSLYLTLGDVATVPHPEALNACLNGVAPLQLPGLEPVDPAVAFWKRSETPEGKPYYWNEITRQRHWERPAVLGKEEP